MLARFALAPLLGAVQVPAPPDVALEWVAPPECPDRAEVLAAISQRLGRTLTAEEARVEGRVVRQRGRGFTLQLKLTAGGRGETREVADPSCAALADAVAVLVAAAVEPTVRVPEPEPEPELGPEPEPEPAAPVVVEPEPAFAEPDPPPEPTPEPDRPLEPAEQAGRSNMSRRPGGFVRLHGGGEVGAVPRVTGAIGLAGGLLWRRWRLELQGLFVAPQSAVRELGDRPAEVRVTLLAGAVHGCGRLGRGAIEVPLCVGLEAGAMRGEARGWPSGRAAYQGWLAGVLGAGVAWHAGSRWGLWGAVQVALSPVFPSFELADATQSVRLWSPSPASGRLLFGVELRLRDPW